MTRQSDMSTPAPNTIAPADDQRLPWPAIGASLAAFAALYFSSGGYPGLIVLALLLVATRLTRSRIPDRVVSVWLARALAYAAILLSTGELERVRISVFFDQGYVYRFGYLCAAEIVLRAWTRKPGGPSRGDNALLSAFVIAAASNTYDRTYLHTIAPIYLLLTVLALRNFRQSGDRGEVVGVTQRWRPPLVGLRVVVTAIALMLGFCVVWTITEYDNQLSYWAVQLLKQRKADPAKEIGLTTSPRLGAVFNPEPSIVRVLRIAGQPSERHLRAMAFDVYENNLWRPGPLERAYERVSESELHRGADAPGARLHFTRMSNALDLIALPVEATDVTADGGVERDPLGTVRDVEEGNRHYELLAPRSAIAQGVAAMPMDEAYRTRALALPNNTDPAVVALAKDVAGNGPPAEQVIRLSNYLRSNYTYSLNIDPGAADPLSTFILKTRAGHCMYFGSAMAVMARAVGIPARFVTGYYAHERTGSAEMTVRQRDAHAWAECWVDRVGWVTVDATPAGGQPDDLFPKPSWKRRLWEDVKDIPGRIRDWLGGLSRAGIVTTILSVTGVALLVWLWQNGLGMFRRAKPRAAELAPADRELAELAWRFERMLARRKIPSPPTRTWREHLAHSGLAGESLSSDFVTAYDSARFGRRKRDALPRLRDIMTRLENLPEGNDHARS